MVLFLSPEFATTFVVYCITPHPVFSIHPTRPAGFTGRCRGRFTGAIGGTVRHGESRPQQQSGASRLRKTGADEIAVAGGIRTASCRRPACGKRKLTGNLPVGTLRKRRETEHVGCPDRTKIRRGKFSDERPGPGRVIIWWRDGQRFSRAGL